MQHSSAPLKSAPSSFRNGALRSGPVRVLITSHDFYPTLGGIETAGMTLARGLAKRGYEVTVATDTPGDAGHFPFRIVREPDALELVRLVQDTDLLWQNHVSLRLAWPVLFLRRPTIFAHHIWLNVEGIQDVRFGWLKRLVCKTGHNVYVSSVLRDDVQIPGPIIPNTYDASTFKRIPQIERDREVAFLGRLVPVKGADVLLDALGLLALSGLAVKSTFIGSGREKQALEVRAASLGIAGHTQFVGPVNGDPLARLLNRHKILVVPSLACGCAVIAARSGGLPDVVGPCGPIVPKNDPRALADALHTLLSDPATLRRHQDAIPLHLQKFAESTHLDACEAVIQQTLRSWSRTQHLASKSRSSPAA
jgi:glycosyltransferase involved in cell wall biosynthesis